MSFLFSPLEAIAGALQIGGQVASKLTSGGGFSEAITRFQNELVPIAIPGVSETIDLFRREAISSELFYQWMKWHGVDRNVADIMREGLALKPTAREAIILYRHNELGKTDLENLNEFTQLMYSIGFNPKDAGHMLKASKFVPPVSDQVRFMVKEAYTPELVKDLIGDETTPQLFKDQIAKQGVDAEDSDRYWIAHYDPMSRTDAEEAFHRLNSDQLKFKKSDMAALDLAEKDIQFEFTDLLRTYKLVDKYPTDRKRYAMLAYKPLSRIDIRRIDDLIDLPIEQLEFYNREFGYSPETARHLAKFTKIANALKDLKPLLLSGDVSLDEAIQELVKIGATKEEAERQINRIAFVVKRAKLAKEKDAAKADIREAFELGIIGSSQAKISLLSLNYDDKEAEFLLKVWEASLATSGKKGAIKDRDLTRADIVKEYKEGLSSRKDAKAKLISMRYDEAEAETILKLTDRDLADTSERDLVKADIRAAFELGIIGSGQAKTYLLDMKYDDKEAEFLLKLWQTSIDLSSKKTPTKGKDLTRADIVKEYKEGLSSRKDAKAKLISMRYDEAEAEIILSIADAQLERASEAKA